jgi:hypothetical protein
MGRVTAKDIHAMLQQFLRSRSDLGVWKAVAAHMIESPNPFGSPSVRKPQRWFMIFSITSFAAIGAFLYFNFWN